jgi:hypothetical protein
LPFSYEHRTQSLASRRKFFRRMLWHTLAALLIILAALGIGVVGYHQTEGMAWIDSLLNSSMILGGMGPVAQLHTVAGKLFASFYALFAGVIFLFVIGILIAPVAHRLLHWLHLEEPEPPAQTPPEDIDVPE